jgi:hypothetical protein
MSAKTTEAVTMRPYKIIVTILPDEGNTVPEPQHRIGIRTTADIEQTQTMVMMLANSLIRFCAGMRCIPDNHEEAP